MENKFYFCLDLRPAKVHAKVNTTKKKTPKPEIIQLFKESEAFISLNSIIKMKVWDLNLELN